jgi:hypothetical protein
MRPALLAAGAVACLFSCAPPAAVEESAAVESTPAPAGSEALAANFPLLPLIEPALWGQLLEAEQSQTGDPSAAVAALSAKLRERHPFQAGGNRVELGGIVRDKQSGIFSLPARVHFPDPGDERHPGEVELVLCTETGRAHETLFITEARPLHLELLLHLSGHVKGEAGCHFRIDVLAADGTRVPVHSLLRAKDGGAVPEPLLWEFSGSVWKDVYSPDLSGDFAILWHAHDSVLRVSHEGIGSGEVKLEVVPHPALKNGDPVVLELIPMR